MEYEQQLNGFGRRVNDIEIALSGNEVKTNRNVTDLTELRKLIGSNAETIGRVETSLARLTGRVAGAVAVVAVVAEALKSFLGR